MAIRPYVGEEALRELVRQIKTRTASVYTVKGSIGVCTYDEGTQQYVHTPANLPYYIWGIDQGPTEWSTSAHIVDASDNEVTLQEGWVFNLAVDYTVLNIPGVPSPFIDKERGEVIKAVTNICIVNVGTAENPVYKYDCLATSVDLTPYQTKLISNDIYYLKNLLDSITSYDYDGMYRPITPDATSAPHNAIAHVYVTGSSSWYAFYYYVNTGYEHNTTWTLVLSGDNSGDNIENEALLHIPNIIEYITAYIEIAKQNKALSSALTMLTPDFTYATVAAMPTTGATAEGIETGDIAYVTETTKLYQATVDGSDNITWAEIGDQTTVEGAIKLLGSLAPNRPVTAAEVQSLFNA